MMEVEDYPAYLCAGFAICVWILLCFRARQYHQYQQYHNEDEFDNQDNSKEEGHPLPFAEITCNQYTDLYDDDKMIIITCYRATANNLHQIYDRVITDYDEDWTRKVKFINSDIEIITNGLFDTSRIDDFNQFATNLSFFNGNLRSIETNSLSRLTKLRELELDQNKLESLQAGSLNGLESLERLDVSHNVLSGFIDNHNFTGVGLKLFDLNLSYNNISFIRRNCFDEFKKLITFNIAYNSLTVLPASLFQYNTLLININLSNNNISEIGNNTFPSSKIKMLDLSFNNLSDILSNSFVGRLLTNRAMSIFRLNDNSLESFPELLNTITVNELSISNNNITDEELMISGNFCASLKVSNMNLKVLTNISMCNTGTILIASHNNLQEMPLWRDMQAMEIVELQYNNISNIPLATFHQFKRLFTLRLDQNHLTELKIGAFSGLNYLVSLNISFNELSSIDHYMLYGLKNLRELYLGGNQLTTLPYDDIFLSLKSLQSLGLNHNQWNCLNLMKILQAMDTRNIEIAHHGYVDYNVTNLGGVRCSDDKNYAKDNHDYCRITKDLYKLACAVTMQNQEATPAEPGIEDIRLHRYP